MTGLGSCVRVAARFCGWLQDWLVNFTLPWLYRRDGEHLYSRARARECRGCLIGSDIQGIKKFVDDERHTDSCRSHSRPSFHRFSLYRFRFPPAVCPRSASCPFIPFPPFSQKRIDNHQDQECIDVMPPFAESKCSIIREIGSFFTFLHRSIFVGPTRLWNGYVRRILWSSQEENERNESGEILRKSICKVSK